MRPGNSGSRKEPRCVEKVNSSSGVYIKWFLEKTGHEGLNNLLAAYEDKSAYAQCIFSIALGDKDESGERIVHTFVGRTAGKIVPPRGSLNFG